MQATSTIRLMEGGGETALLSAAARGRPEAVGELYNRHADAVYALALRVTGSPDDADDVLQDVFVGLPRALRSYRDTGHFTTWLKRVTVRVALMRMRSHRRRRESPLDAVPEPGGVRGAHPVDRIALDRAVARLPDRLRAVFVLREIEGHTHAEIAELLGISVSSSMTRLSRAWRWLRAEVKQ
jgi:RNA polymerase sigma-70 factor (ECF subfamily)